MDRPDTPFPLFDTWLAEAEAGESHDANAMALATATASGAPSVRMVLLKDVSAGGFVFYTNTESRKGDELAANARVSLLFYWKSLRRQIRIEGRAQAVTAAEADAYFATRPRGSQVGAWASDQSRRLDDRADLTARVAEIERRYEGADVPRPPHWSGWRVLPDRFPTRQFWDVFKVAPLRSFAQKETSLSTVA
ncbi:MAG: pyridoxamine 5'-phosphate oxidase, partial [Pseudomonadota bacterium]